MPLSHLLSRSSGELQAELQLILNAVVEGLCGLDANGKITFCNDALLRMTGFQTEELIGKSLHGMLHHSRPDGSKYPEEECALRRAVACQREIHASREILWRKDGSCFPAEYWAHPLRQCSSQTAAVVTIQDISERERAIEALRTSEEKLRRILSSVPDVSWASDRERRTTYISPKVEAILGYTKEEFCAAGANLRLGLIHAEDFSRVNRGYRALFEEGSVFDEEYRIRRKDGNWIWIHDRATGVREENGVLYADGVFSDITARKQAEAELHWKTAFLEAQANSTIDGILVVGPNGQRLLHNQRFVDLLRVPAELLASKEDRPMLEYALTLFKNPDSFLAKVSHLYQNPSETSRDELELKDGRVIDRYSAPVIDKEGAYYGRIWTFRDITERRRNEDMLRQLSAAVEQSPISVVITDPGGHITYVNQKFSEATGYTSAEVLGKNPRFLNARRSPPELYRILWSTITKGKEWHGELCNKKKNGELYWETATIRAITDAQGVITHYLAVKEDITERRRAEKEFRLTQFSVEHASDAIEWIGPDGRLLYVNEASCRDLGYSRQQLLSLTIPDINPHFSQESWRKFWNEMKARRSMTFESQHKSKQGKLFPVEITATFLEFDAQEFVFAFVRDITERRELEGQLRQAQKLEGIGQLAAGIAHEINTPTQFVTDNLTFLRDSWKSTHELLELYRKIIGNAAGTLPASMAGELAEAERRCDLDFIEAEVPRAIEQGLDGAHRVAKIVRAMKEFSHPDAAEKTATDLNKAVESTLTVARNEWKYVAEAITELDESLPPVVCYPGDINQVILNLLVNAAHAIKEKVKDGEKGKITVCTRRRDEFAEISVTDSGTGIPEAIGTRVFDPFFTTKEVGKGTGQGLSLAHTVVVKKHGGKIWFETEIGVGTTFFIDLPIEPVEAAKES